MNFFSALFLLFLGIVFVVNWMLPAQYRYLWLLASSYFFYASWDLRYTAVLLIVTAITYMASWFLDNKARSEKSKKLVLVGSVLVLAGTVVFFKFWNFGYSRLIRLFGISDSAEGGLIIIITPIGLSFYVLTAIGYLIDILRGKVSAERNVCKVALFLSFFPTVLSGPIERGNNLLQQICSPNVFCYEKTKKGCLQILYGYFLKVLVANRLAVIVNGAFSGYPEQTGATMMIAVILYGIQLYTDFAGYTYIALGIGRVLGFDLIENFRQPYFSTSIKEFWNRWHISLSSWLRDYVYIPLGGNRKGRFIQYFNLIITFLVSGLWHGTGWQFIFWGVLHGVYQVLSKALTPVRKLINQKPISKRVYFCHRVLQALFTFVLVDFAWLFFRASSIREGFGIVKLIITEFHPQSTIVEGLFLGGFDPNRFVILVCEMLIVLAVDLVHEKGKSIIAFLDARRKLFRWIVYLAGVIAVITGAVYDYGLEATSFIYTRF